MTEQAEIGIALLEEEERRMAEQADIQAALFGEAEEAARGT